MEEDNKSLPSRLKDIEEKLELIAPKPKIKEKPFKLKSKVRLQAKKAHMKGKILVFYLRENRFIEPIIAKAKSGMIQIGEKFYHTSMMYYYLYKMGKDTVPALVIPEWKLTPLGTKDYEEAVEKKDLEDPQDLMIKALEAKENMMADKPKLGGKIWIWIIIGAAIVFYILFGGK